MKRGKRILLIGGSGTLGSCIIKSKIFKKIDAPKKNQLNLTNKSSIKKFLFKRYDLIINCAAVARMKECEKKPIKAIKINIFGTLNLINEIKNIVSSMFKKN